MRKVLLGIDVLKRSNFKELKGTKVSLLVNHASVDSHLEHTSFLFSRAKGLKLVSLLGPQHGLYGNTQDNMIEWEGFVHPHLKIPVHSLYGKHRKPTPSMLKETEVLVIDLWDVGARYYTFVWTAKLCLEACRKLNIPVMVLDRPNPVGGTKVEGNLLKKEFRSFVGLFEIPNRHGLTFGELIHMMNEEEKIGCQLKIIKMEGWERKLLYNEISPPWVLPSPNMPTLDTALVYSGFCLLEGTNLSEGRGTCRPFEIWGAPFIDPYKVKKSVEKYSLSGLYLRPHFFQPTFNKYKGELCGGFQIHITSPQKFNPVRTAVALLFAVYEEYPARFKWKDPPYEYEYQKMPIDILWGDTSLRENIKHGIDGYKELLKDMEEDELNFYQKRKKYLLY